MARVRPHPPPPFFFIVIIEYNNVYTLEFIAHLK